MNQPGLPVWGWNFFTKNFSPWCSSVTLKRRRMKASSGFFAASYSLSAKTIILMPVAIRNTAKT